MVDGICEINLLSVKYTSVDLQTFDLKEETKKSGWFGRKKVLSTSYRDSIIYSIPGLLKIGVKKAELNSIDFDVKSATIVYSYPEILSNNFDFDRVREKVVSFTTDIDSTRGNRNTAYDKVKKEVYRTIQSSNLFEMAERQFKEKIGQYINIILGDDWKVEFKQMGAN